MMETSEGLRGWVSPGTRLLATAAASLLAAVLFVSPANAAVAVYQFEPGWATFGLALPEGAAQTGVQVGSLATQVDVKTRWADGSIRFAVVTAQIPSSGSYAIVPGASATTPFTPTWPAASVSFVIGGTTYTAALPAYNGANSWLSGPLVNEARSIVTPVSSGGPHPLLQVVFDVRSYAGGGHRIDVCVQNVKDSAVMDKVTYAVSVVASGQALWSRSGVTSYAYTRWRKTFAVGITEAKAIPDLGSFHESGALPRYLSSIDNISYDTTGAAWDVMGFGNMQPSMVQGGGREDIAPFPWWQVRYLVHKQDNQRNATILNGNNSGSWSLHITGADGVSLVKVTDAASEGYWFDHARRHLPGPGPAGPARSGDGWLRGSRMGDETYSDHDAKVDPEHVPNLTFLPYLLTGDRYFLDQTKLWAAWAIVQPWPQDPLYPEPVFVPGFNRSRGGSRGLMWVSGLGRELGWPLRNVILAAIACPDTDGDKSYFRTIVQNNLDALGEYVTEHALAGGATQAVGWEGVSVRNSAGVVTGKYLSLWRLAYTAWAVDYASKQKLWSLGGAAELRNRIIRMQVGFINNIPDERGKAPYYPAVARVTDNGATLEFMTSWSQVYTDNMTYTFDNPPAAPGWWAFPASLLGYYGADAYMLTTMGLRLGITGSAEAYSWLMSYRDPQYGSSLLADLNTRAGFAFEAGSAPGTSEVRPPTNITVLP
jgi:hypothetical protein